jgi:hypothetical protein
MPFDEFTITQIAGDLLPDATEDDILATAFHRNTMTNDEGGTDDEEFRVAAVKDRVATTMSAWMGLTMACAECHTHKYDPFTQTEYYRLYAFFNQTQDADREDESPTAPYTTPEQQARLLAVEGEIATLDSRIEAIVARALAAGARRDAGVRPEQSLPDDPADCYWIDDQAPPGAQLRSEGASDGWQWVSSIEHPPAAGSRSLVQSSGGFSQQIVADAPIPLQVHEGDSVVTHVWLEESRLPREIMLQVRTADGSWEHRAYWGENLIALGANQAGSLRSMGALPERGRWVRLEVPVADIGLRAGDEIDGLAFTQFGGTVRWDGTGLVTRRPPDTRWEHDCTAWADLLRARQGRGLPGQVRAALLAEPPSAEHAALLERQYLRHFHADTLAQTRELSELLASMRREAEAIEAQAARVPVMAELPEANRRPTHVLDRGSFLSPLDPVTPGVPEALHPLGAGGPHDRLALAHWLVSPDNPLTARVTVNRWWEQFFGRGLVETAEDFGAQGAPATHPELLDWLAAEFVESGWSTKALCRTIVTSATYIQASAAGAVLLELDPHNALLARGPRFRLEAEMIRDQALAVSGLLSERMYGPPVFPAQPDGVWMVVYSGDAWVTSTGEDAHRRSLYTFWRRTSPYPSLTTFDAPSREICSPRRIRTNTPLQALVTMNDAVYVEAAQALARRMIAEGGPIASDRAAHGFRLCLAREPTPEEVDVMLALVADEYARYREHPADAVAAATDPLGPLPDGADAAEVAAWTIAASVLLNLDEFITRS